MKKKFDRKIYKKIWNILLDYNFSPSVIVTQGAKIEILPLYSFRPFGFWGPHWTTLDHIGPYWTMFVFEFK